MRQDEKNRKKNYLCELLFRKRGKKKFVRNDYAEILKVIINIGLTIKHCKT